MSGELADSTLDQQPRVEAVETDHALADDAHLDIPQYPRRRPATDGIHMHPNDGAHHRRVLLGQVEALGVEMKEQLVLALSHVGLLLVAEAGKPQKP